MENQKFKKKTALYTGPFSYVARLILLSISFVDKNETSDGTANFFKLLCRLHSNVITRILFKVGCAAN